MKRIPIIPLLKIMFRDSRKDRKKFIMLSEQAGTRLNRILIWKYSKQRDSKFFTRSEEHTSELQSLRHLVCRLLLEKKKTISTIAPKCSPRMHDYQHHCTRQTG